MESVVWALFSTHYLLRGSGTPLHVAYVRDGSQSLADALGCGFVVRRRLGDCVEIVKPIPIETVTG